ILLEKRAKAAAKKAAEGDILDEKEPSATTAATEAEDTIKDLRAEIKHLKRQNAELQKALCSKIFETALIEDRQLQPPTYQLLIKPSKALGKKAQCLDMTVGILNEASEVHVGHGTYIDVEIWQRLLQVPMDSTFCKQLAVRLWGNEVLAQRSLTGTLSKCALSKGLTRTYPPLSPVKLASMSVMTDKEVTSDLLSAHISAMEEENRRLHRDLASAHSRLAMAVPDRDALRSNPDMVQFYYTGLPNYAVLEAVYSLVEPHVRHT
ncbi:hypothetical protein MTO96_036396, partial [Rhipicephalus appendiculatus]